MTASSTATTVHPPSRHADQAREDSVLELATLLGSVVRNLKQRADPPPRAFREAFEAHSLGPRHMPVMIAVALGEGSSVSEIARRVGLSVATTSLLVGELSRAGLLERAEDPSDRRRTLVTLHKDHRAVMRRFIRKIVEPMRRTLNSLAPAARDGFLEGSRLLAKESAPGGQRS
ncbi:MAG TPA: MarR family transcriptional regulator [Solirubrobacteraceae bacterium]|jgi:DNA-binding MarR family transcriptional regulator|nr:MarR family transcriptional regulator [Solirubrobacteraceae bacterium]